MHKFCQLIADVKIHHDRHGAAHCALHMQKPSNPPHIVRTCMRYYQGSLIDAIQQTSCRMRFFQMELVEQNG